MTAALPWDHLDINELGHLTIGGADTLALAEESCEVLSMQERNESLESYYISLVGGNENG